MIDARSSEKSNSCLERLPDNKLLAYRDELRVMRYQSDPVGFLEGPLQTTMWDKLEEITRSVWENKYTAVQSANNVGKTFIAARIAIAWFNLYRDSCKVITTAPPPARQIRDLLWGEIRSTQKAAFNRGYDLAGGDPSVMTLVESDDWWMQGFTIPTTGTDEDRMSKFQGHHAEHVLIIFDEAHGVPPEIYRATDGMLAGYHCHILLITNPLAQTGPYYQAIKTGKYNVITIAAFDHPNVIEDKPIIPKAVSRGAVQEKIDEWTASLQEDEEPDAECFQVPWTEEWRHVVNPAFSYRFLGRFPSQASNALINIAWIQSAQSRWRDYVMEHGEVPPNGDRPKIGMDVAEFGDDSNCLTKLYNNFIPSQRKWRGLDPIDNANRVANEIGKEPYECLNVDATGVGSSIAPDLTKRYDLPARSVKVGERATARVEEGEFYRLRDQMFWAAREWFRLTPDAMIPDTDELLTQLSALTYEYDLVTGKIKVLDKKSWKKLLGGASPDETDSFVMIFAPVVYAASWSKIKAAEERRGSNRPSMAGFGTEF